MKLLQRKLALKKKLLSNYEKARVKELDFIIVLLTLAKITKAKVEIFYRYIKNQKSGGLISN